MVAIEKNRYPHEPDYAVAPGEVLQGTIDTLGMTQADLARRTGLSKKTINQIIQGHEPLSYDTALRLERVTCVPARFWNNLEAIYRERLARLEEKKCLPQDLEWLKSIPTRELIRRGAFPGQKDRVGLLHAALTFFGVNSPREWKAIWESSEVVFRGSQEFKSNRGALAAWMRLGELAGQRLECQAYDKDLFRGALERIRRLTVADPETILSKIRQECAAAGVTVVFTPEIKGAPVTAMTQWLTPEKALLQLSFRFKTHDHFWFSFFHVAGHILKHGKKEKFVEGGGGDDAKEEEANRFAEDFLIPRDRAAELPGIRTHEQIITFAESVGIAPGIVLGRLQKMGLINPSSSDNSLKEQLRWFHGPDGEAFITRVGPNKDSGPAIVEATIEGDTKIWRKGTVSEWIYCATAGQVNEVHTQSLLQSHHAIWCKPPGLASWPGNPQSGDRVWLVWRAQSATDPTFLLGGGRIQGNSRRVFNTRLLWTNRDLPGVRAAAQLLGYSGPTSMSFLWLQPTVLPAGEPIQIAGLGLVQAGLNIATQQQIQLLRGLLPIP